MNYLVKANAHCYSIFKTPAACDGANVFPTLRQARAALIDLTDNRIQVLREKRKEALRVIDGALPVAPAAADFDVVGHEDAGRVA